MADTQRPAPGPVPAGPSGYVIRPPQPATPTPASPSPAPAATPTPAAPQPSGTLALPPEPTMLGGLTQNGAVIGAGVMLVLAIVFFLLRGAVRNHLIDNRASLAAAGAASWALFVFLLVLAFTVVFGIAGQLWTVTAFIGPLGLLVVVTLCLFLYLFGAARRLGR